MTFTIPSRWLSKTSQAAELIRQKNNR